MDVIRHDSVGSSGIFAESANETGSIHPTGLAFPGWLDEVSCG